MKDSLSLWFREMRANFLVLAVVLVAIGGAVAYHDGTFHAGRFVLTLVGVVFAHISVNLFNGYSDWKSGIDARTVRTPFSGGSGNLPKGLNTPEHVRNVAWVALAAAFTIGLSLAWISGWQVLLFMAAGGMAIVWYTDYLAQWVLGELASGMTLGSFVVLGTYFVQTGGISAGCVWVSIPPGILTFLLLLLNEFPDAEADLTGGRRHIVIMAGKRIAGVIYSIMLLGVYIVIGTGVASGAMPGMVSLAFITLPLAFVTVYHVLRFSTETDRLNPALGVNVIIVLVTDALLSLGYFLA